MTTSTPTKWIGFAITLAVLHHRSTSPVADTATVARTATLKNNDMEPVRWALLPTPGARSHLVTRLTTASAIVSTRAHTDDRTLTISGLVLGLLLLEAWYLRSCYQTWLTFFAPRLPRVHPCCPSHFSRPNLETDGSVLNRLSGVHSCPYMRKALQRVASTVSTAGAPSDAAIKMQPWKCPVSRRKTRPSLETGALRALLTGVATPQVGLGSHSMRRLSGNPAANARGVYQQHPIPEATAPIPEDNSLQTRQAVAQELNMSHVHVSLSDYMWASHIVMVPLILAFAFGMIKIWLIDWLHRLQLRAPPSSKDVHDGVCDLLLESSLSTHVQSVDTSDDGETMATFVFTTFPIFVNVLPAKHPAHRTELKAEGRGSLVVLKIDPTARRFVEGKFDGHPLRVDDVLLLLGFHISTFTHPQLHSFANWAIDPADHRKHDYLRKTSVVTAIYNHAGLVGNPKVQSIVYSDAHGRELSAVFGEAMKHRPPAHPQVRKLAKHSRLVNFLVKFRPRFFRLYGEMKADFPENYSAEAYFLSTVMHSLEHTMFERSYNPWVTAAIDISPQYRAMSDVMKIVRNCFIEDLPWLTEDMSFQNSPMRFHQDVFAAAVKIDPELAAFMQTTIVK